MNPPILPPAIFLMGPTAAGKTDLAIALTERLPCDIISVDSAQVYRGLDIGTAKPDVETLTRAPHRLISFLDPSEPYSAAQFRRDALREMASIHAAGRIPLLVGGTMLYFKILRDGIIDLPPADMNIRTALEIEAQQTGWPAMHARLVNVDPVTAARLHPNHSQRILRALEVHVQTGIPLSTHQLQTTESLPFHLTEMAITTPERDILHQRIETRFDAMLAAGLLEEVQKLYARGDLHRDLPAIRSVGYRQAWDLMEGKCDAADFRTNAIQATRQLAKRQLTWLRGWSALHWLDSSPMSHKQTSLEHALKLLEAANI